MGHKWSPDVPRVIPAPDLVSSMASRICVFRAPECDCLGCVTKHFHWSHHFILLLYLLLLLIFFFTFNWYLSFQITGFMMNGNGRISLYRENSSFSMSALTLTLTVYLIFSRPYSTNVSTRTTHIATVQVRLGKILNLNYIFICHMIFMIPHKSHLTLSFTHTSFT